RSGDHAGNGGDGEFGWVFIFRNEYRAEDNFRVGTNDPYIARKLDFDVSCEWLLDRHPTERAARFRQVLFAELVYAHDFARFREADGDVSHDAQSGAGDRDETPLSRAIPVGRNCLRIADC